MLPWFHLILPKAFILNRVNTKNDLKIKSIKELGLNMYSLKDYVSLFSKSRFKIEMFKKKCVKKQIYYDFQAFE